MEVTEGILGQENRRNKQANINNDICSLLNWYLLYGKIVQTQLLTFGIDSHTCKSVCNFTCAKVTKLA